MHGAQYDRLVYAVVSIPGATERGVQLRVRDAGGAELTEWFPKSQVDYDENEVVMPRWLALDKGLGKPLRIDSEDTRRCAGLFAEEE